MKLQLKHTYQLAGVVLLLLGTLTMGAAVMSSRSGALAEEAAARRYLSYQLADELRQSSDDLTRLARTYVATGDPKWESQYLEVVDIRAGKRPRPAQYDRIYWDFRAANAQPEAEAAGQAVPLLELMKQAGFTEAELGKLAEAQANSDDLIHTEARAMRMVKEAVAASQSGTQWLDTPEHSQALALMHDLTYHQQKAKIMKPVNEFLALLDERTSAEMAAASVARHRWSQMAMAFVATLIVLMGGGLFYLRHRTSAVLDDVSRVATGIAQGRLDHAIPTALSGQEGGVMRALERMQRQLARVVGSIRQSADSVVTASTQIALGNQDLSARTEQQASALEQTAATMEELGTTVRHNADSASQANELAQNASAVAVQGGQVVDQVVSTMQNISDSSRRIGDIIGVIDGIAFQTNILALNAAVEAARAGEQGRGFAVVAGEVRSLAHRSAEAAKEIKTLIGRSVEQVEQGTELVNQAGRTMGDIVGSIQRVSDIVAEITAASTEQSNGVQQVGDAVGQLDHATQQNAALVEQSAAAAESLKAQASELVQAVAVFQLQNPAQAVV